MELAFKVIIIIDFFKETGRPVATNQAVLKPSPKNPDCPIAFPGIHPSHSARSRRVTGIGPLLARSDQRPEALATGPLVAPERRPGPSLADAFNGHEEMTAVLAAELAAELATCGDPCNHLGHLMDDP